MYQALIRLLSWLVNTFWAVVATGVILFALVISLGRYYLPHIDAGRDLLNSRLGELLNADVISSGLYGEWTEVNPILGVRAVQVSTADQPALSLQGAQIKIDLFNSLVNRQVLYRDVQLNGLQLHLYRNEKGFWSSPLSTGGGGSLDLKALYDSAHNINFVNSQLIFHDQDRVDVIRISDAVLLQGINIKQTELRLVDNINPKPIRLVVESTGKASNDDLYAQAYLDVEQLDLEAYRFLFPDHPLKSEAFNARLWLQWQSGQPLTVQGDLSFQDLQLNDQPVGNVLGKVGVKWSGDNLAVFLNDASIYEQGKEWILPALRLDADLARQDWFVSSGDIDVSALEYWLSSPVFSSYESLQKPLQGLKPAGQIETLSLAVVKQKERFVPLLYANVKNASIDRWEGIPAFTGVSGVLQLAGRSGHFRIADQLAVTMDVRPELEKVLNLQAPQGDIYWHIGKERASLFANDLKAEYLDQTLNVDLGLDLPLSHSAPFPPKMSIAARVENSDIASLNTLIPYSLLDDDLAQWLLAADMQGEANYASFFINTSLSPSRNWRPAIAAQANVKNAEMTFDSTWPRLTQISGDIDFADTSIRLFLEHAQALSSTAEKVAFEMDVRGDKLPSRLHIEGDARSEDAVTLFQTSLRDVVEDGLEGWQAEGDLALVFDMAGELLTPEGLDLKVNANIDNSRFWLDEADIVFDAIRSDFTLVGERMSAENLSAEVFGQPWSGGIRTVDTLMGGLYYQLYAEGDVGFDAFDNWLDLPLMGFAEGDFNAEAFFNFGGEEDPLLMVNSHLHGLAIELPAPFHKTPEALYPTALRIQFAEVPLLELNSPLVNMQQLLLEEGVVANVLLGKQSTLSYQLPDNGVLVNGAMDTVDSDQWLEVITRYEAFQTVYPSSDEHIPAEIDNFQVAKLVMGNSYIEDLMLHAADTPGSWLVEFESAHAGGELTWYPHQPMEVSLEHLHLPFPYIDEALVDAPIEPEGFEPAFVNIEQLIIEEEPYGSWQFFLEPEKERLVVKDIKADVKGVAVGGIETDGATLEWTHGTTNITQLALKASVNNVKDLFVEFDSEPMLTSKEGYTNISLSWPGDPMQFDSLALTGDIDLLLKDGQFLSTEGAPTGLLKLLGVFNFDNLVRRLKFDFGDVVNEGLSYDRFKGNIELQPGLILLEEPLLVDGPSSDFGLAGYLDLEAETIDGEITAVVPVSSNLPWAAALAGGLPAAAGVYLASKIFSDGFDRLSSARYSIKGSWEDPKIKFENLFSDKKKRSDSANKAKVEAEQKQSELQSEQTVDEAEVSLPESEELEVIRSEEQTPDQVPAMSSQ